MTAVTQLAHHGMIFVPVGFTYGPAMFDVETVHGGSAWGSGTFAGPTGARQPSEMEIGQVTHQARPHPPAARLRRCFCCCCRRGREEGRRDPAAEAPPATSTRPRRTAPTPIARVRAGQVLRRHREEAGGLERRAHGLSAGARHATALGRALERERAAERFVPSLHRRGKKRGAAARHPIYQPNIGRC